jgi:hypothetical protein
VEEQSRARFQRLDLAGSSAGVRSRIVTIVTLSEREEDNALPAKRREDTCEHEREPPTMMTFFDLESAMLEWTSFAKVNQIIVQEAWIASRTSVYTNQLRETESGQPSDKSCNRNYIMRLRPRHHRGLAGAPAPVLSS